jgi:hypothetical protein
MNAPTTMRLSNANGALSLVCKKCTRFGVFPAEDRHAAEKDAAAKGWENRDGVTICPACRNPRCR